MVGVFNAKGPHTVHTGKLPRAWLYCSFLITAQMGASGASCLNYLLADLVSFGGQLIVRQVDVVVQGCEERALDQVELKERQIQ